jgi:hypothetical protein
MPGFLQKKLEKSHPWLCLTLFTPWGLINSILILFYCGFAGGAIFYSCKLIAQNFSTFGVFAKCYACPPSSSG